MVSSTAVSHRCRASVRAGSQHRGPRRAAPDEQINLRSSIPFILVHFLPFLAVFTGVPLKVVVLAFVTFVGAHVLHHRRLPPVLLAPQLPAGPGRAVRDGVRRHDGRAEGSAVVGRAPPQPPPVRRHRARHALAAEGLLVESRRLDPVRQVRRVASRQDQATSRSTPSCASSTSTTGSGRGRSASSAT